MGRSPCCSKQGLNHGAWTAEEDLILSKYITLHGGVGWHKLPQKGFVKNSSTPKSVEMSDGEGIILHSGNKLSSNMASFPANRTLDRGDCWAGKLSSV